MAIKTILIVEDDKDLREILADFFSTKQITVYQATNGQEALQILSENKNVEVVISDVQMPEMDGIQLLKKLREISAEYPFVIMMTGQSPHSKEALFELGADYYIEKPFNLDEFLWAVSTAQKVA